MGSGDFKKGFGNTKGSRSSSNDSGRLYGEPNTINISDYKETYIGLDGRVYKEIHNTDHGNPKHHTNPHEHIISWSEEGNPIFSKG